MGVPQSATAKKLAKAKVSDAEFRRRLKISLNEERSALTSFAPKTRVEVYVPIRHDPAYIVSLSWVIEEFTQTACRLRDENLAGSYLSRSNEVIDDVKDRSAS